MSTGMGRFNALSYAGRTIQTQPYVPGRSGYSSGAHLIGDGPLPPSSGVMIIGDAPGLTEMQRRRVFVGKSGAELDANFSRAGIDRADMYLTTLVKVQPALVGGKQPNPSAELLRAYEDEIFEEIAACRPRWIGAIGSFTARHLIGSEFERMETCHGMAYPLSPEIRERVRAAQIIARRVAAALEGSLGASAFAERFGSPDEDDSWIDACRVVPLYHPAAGFHNPEIAPLVWYDIRTLAAYAQGRLPAVVPRDDSRHPHYTDGLNGWHGTVGLVGCDTEGSIDAPWSVQVSNRPGTGSVVRSSSMYAKATVASRVQTIFDKSDRVIFQAALHDMPVLDAMGLTVPWDKVEDIFVMADVLRLVPRGLKAGARRDCGMEMRSYRDVVAPAERRLAKAYVEAAIEARRCPVCDGVGKVAAVNSKGVQLKRLEKCASCTDGGLWPARNEGWEVQRYLRGLQKDLDSGKYDTADESTLDEDDTPIESPRNRFRSWPPFVVDAITEAIGHDMPTPTLSDVPLREAIDYAGRDADATLRRYAVLRPQIDELELEQAYRLDLDVMPIAAEIQKNGMRINRKHFSELAEELKDRKADLLVRLESHLSRPIRPGSPDEIALLLYSRMGLKELDEADERDFGLSYGLTPEKWTPSRKRGAVDEKTLEGMRLKNAHNESLVRTIDLLLEWKMCDKIEQFAVKLPKMADWNDRIHTRIKIGPATFRWASAEPNLQQIPSRDKRGGGLGARVRAGFEVAEGRRFGNRDFDQIEVRVLAWYAQDETLLRLFRDGPTCPAATDPTHLYHYKGKCKCHDPHFITAQRVFRTPLEAVTKTQRDSAKNIKFGVVYGITARGLKAQMDLRGEEWSVDECQQLIDLYLYEAYPGIGNFILDAHAEARRNNMVRSLMGHIRYTPAVHSPIASISEEALRQAANFKIQCTAAELMKVAERDLWKDCRERFAQLDTMILMSEHDALAVETPDDDDIVAEVDALMAVYMTDPYPLEGVSITSGGKWGRNWAEAK